ncbi:ABC transporter permease [Desulfoscipio gibsoniae]|uniref:ABC-type transport system, involved in lipoprotein release, permease component n=1 Tax=Desulfoscipio gibsoniae DSM 7213 TaxID=767817 RepID=R4KDP9_9FIRM|nr:ABC transporter permease [Desulfoscipio gibsoniae]AGK99811.1 ABC-type transport system, involved in lipoprotein release, permease component [Desulfoscipio gibsoniae DSM 7213]
MQTYIRIACRYIRQYPQRTIAMILSITLSVFLIVAIGSLNESAKNSQVVHCKNYGAQHVIYRELDQKQTEKVKAYQNVQRVAVLAFYGEWKSPNGLTVNLLATDNNNLSMENTCIKAGKFPSQTDEIAIEGWVLDQLRLPHKLGQTLEISLGEKGEKRNYTLVGIIKDRMDEKSTGRLNAFVTSHKEILSERDGHLYALVEFKPEVKIKEEINKLGKVIGLDANSKEQHVLPNNMLLSAMGQINTVDWDLIKISLMLMLVAGMVIFSVYSISVLRRIQDYGMMRAIGSSSRQILYIILWEIVIIYVIGVLLGIASGAAFVQLFKGAATDIFIFDALDAFGNVSLDIIVISGLSIKLAVLTALGAVLAAGIRVAWMAVRISPLEAINRSTQDEKIHVNEKEGWIERQLDITKKITIKNLKRNKKAVIFTIIAMSIGCCLFMVKSFAFEFWEREQDLYYADIRPGLDDEFRLNVNNRVPMMVGYTWEQIAELKGQPEVEKLTATHMLYGRMKIANSQLNGEYGKNYIKTMEKRLSEFDKEVEDVIEGPDDRMGFAFPGDSDNELVIRSTVLGLSEAEWASFSKNLIQKEQPAGEKSNRPLAIIRIPEVNKQGTFWSQSGKEKLKMEPIFNIKVGDTIVITYPREGYEESLDNWNLIHQYEKHRDKYVDREFTVAGITKVLPEQDSYWLGAKDAPYVIISGRVFQEITGIDTYRIMSLDMKDGFSESDYKSLKEKVHQTAELIPGTGMEDRVESNKESEKAQNEYLLFYAAIAAVLIIIGGLSIYNNINYNLISRLREHGILKAIGLTASQFKRMVKFEGLLYGAISALFSCALALLIELGMFVYYAYFACTLMREQFFIEWKSFLLVILINLCIGYLAALGPAGQINKLPITEAIRSTE